MLELRTLGAVEIHDGRGRLLAVSPKPLALLVYLAVARPRGPQQRDTLLALLYPELDQEHARMAMRQLLRALRAAVGADVVQGDRQTVALAAERLTCDVHAFEVALAAGDAARVVAQYGGAFLPGFFLSGCPEFDHWVDTERSRLERAYAGALEQLALEADAAGDGPRAVALWRQLAEVDPYATRVTVRLIAALEVAGNRAGALQVAERHAQRLRDELDAEPSPEVEALARRMREQPAPAVQVSRGSTRDRLARAVARRYRVDRAVGAGGMALVYLADDLKLGRPVALKVLRPELAAAIGHERFLSEIDMAAGLAHPNILPLHDAGEADGLVYYVMPYVEGESLRARLARQGPLDVAEAVRIAREVAEALAHAHGKGIVHRDIKPANILLQANHAVVSDFGVALAIGNAVEDPALLGTTGTPAYMSPEQAAGSPNVDARSDLFSLGCVLHEMLTGSTPDLEPVPPGALATKSSDAVPGNVEAALAKALAKSPADRFETAFAFTQALSDPHVADRGSGTRVGFRIRSRIIGLVTVIAATALGGWWLLNGRGGGTARIESLAVLPEPATAAEIPRIAVLPFANLGSSEDEWFADAITVEISSRIADVSGLHVISRTSAMQYKNHSETLQQIGEELSVEYVLEGTTRTDRAPDGSGRVRVTPQLIRISDDAHLWTDRYTANLVPGEIFDVQEQIANQVAEALDVTLLEPERRRLAARPTDNQEALEYFLRGMNYADRSDDEQDQRNAVQMFQKAVELDPDFALAYARLSRVHSRMWFNRIDYTQERLAMAKEAVDEALRLDPDLPDAHMALGKYYYWGYLDYDRALAEYAIAQRSQPNRVDLISSTAYVQRRQGKFVEALANIRKAAELNPRSAVTVYEVAVTHGWLRNPVEAARYYDRAISLSPGWTWPYYHKAWVYLTLEASPERARAVLEDAQSVGVASAWLAYLWVSVEVWDGDYQAALDRLAGVPSEFEIQGHYAPKAQLYAQTYGLMGDRQLERAHYDSARTILETKVRERPDDDRYRSALGIAYAGLGRREDAIREGELAVELFPMSKEALQGAIRLQDLARIYTMVGDYDAAIDQLEILLAVPSTTSVPMLRIDPTWNPLRDQPRFQALLDKYGN